jgi:hypothetical protein
MTVLRWWGVIAGFALLFPLSPRVFLLLANYLIATTMAHVTHHTSADHEVTWILWVLAFCELFEESMPLPSLFNRHHCHMHILGIWISGFLPDVGCCSALVMEIAIFDLCFYAEDYCDGVVTCLCSGIDTCGFPRDDAVLRLLLLTLFPSNPSPCSAALWIFSRGSPGVGSVVNK